MTCQYVGHFGYSTFTHYCHVITGTKMDSGGGDPGKEAGVLGNSSGGQKRIFCFTLGHSGSLSLGHSRSVRLGRSRSVKVS